MPQEGPEFVTLSSSPHTLIHTAISIIPQTDTGVKHATPKVTWQHTAPINASLHE